MEVDAGDAEGLEGGGQKPEGVGDGGAELGLGVGFGGGGGGEGPTGYLFKSGCILAVDSIPTSRNGAVRDLG